MNTEEAPNRKLIPPPITPNWRPSRSREGLMEYSRTTKLGGVVAELSRHYVQDDDEHEANCRFFGATKAMSDVLNSYLSLNPMCHESYGAEEAPQEGCDCPTCSFTLRVKDVLFSAGYTEEGAPTQPCKPRVYCSVKRTNGDVTEFHERVSVQDDSVNTYFTTIEGKVFTTIPTKEIVSIVHFHHD